MQPSPLSLPQYPTTLIGRNRVTTALVDLLGKPEARLLTLIGSSGTGKTRLSLQVAETMRETFNQGRYFVALAPVSNPLFVLPTIAQAMDIKESGDSRLLDRIVERLDGKAMLVILDNFEQVRAAASEIDALIDQTAHIKFLVTSQVALGSSHETVFEVPPLSFPDDASLPADTLLGYSAIALFVDRLQSVQPRFKLTKEHAPAIVEICRLVQGLPLAIELIAAHSASLSPADLLMFVRNHLTLGGRGSAPIDRERILYPVLDWCHSRLSGAQQILFGRLGAFVGGCTSDAVASIYQARGERDDVAKGIATLVEKHLVLEETLPGQQPRFIMLDAIREYAHRRLRKRKESASVDQLHTDYYLELSDQAKAGMIGPDQLPWSMRLGSEIHNIRTVLQRALDLTRGQDALRICGNLVNFWYRQGYLTEGQRWCAQALEQREGAPAGIVSEALHASGVLALGQGQYAEARRFFSEAADIRRSNNDPALTRSLTNLGIVASELGDFAEAERLFEEAQETSRVLNNPQQRAMILLNLGNLLMNRGELDRAHGLQTEVLGIFRGLGDSSRIGIVLHNLAEIAAMKGDDDEARRYLEETLALLRQINDRVILGYALTLLSLIMARRGRLKHAQELISEALTIRHEINDQRGIIESLDVGAILLAYGDHHADAARLADLAALQRTRVGAAQQLYVKADYAALERLLAANLADAERATLRAQAEALEVTEAIKLIQSAPF